MDGSELATGLLERIEERTAKVVIIGQGYVGLPLAMRAAEMGYRVVGYDISVDRVRSLAAGRSYVEDISDEELGAALDNGYHPTRDPLDLRGFDVVVITVPTPLHEGAPDLTYIEEAGADIARSLQRGALVSLESTTYPGTTDELLRPILERSGLRVGTDFFLGYSPERIDPGNTRWSLATTPKVVSGLEANSKRVMEAFYGSLVEKVVPVKSTAEAELTKLLENTFRHVNIALVNELAVFAHELDVDIWGAIEAASTKPFGFMRFTPGPGVGGHCLPIDPSYLAWRVERRLGHRFRFVELANDVNRSMPDYVVRRAQSMLNVESKATNGARILVLGLAYKAATSDWRESPSTAVIERLANLGAEVRVHDPLVPIAESPALTRVECSVDEIEAADLVLLLVDHPELPLETVAARAHLVLDTRDALRDFNFRGQSL
jgi:UDP-N-acetyl-D-glucosamine dehydrogenase